MSECQLTNEELIRKVRMWVDELCRTGGKGWSLQVPVNMERDPDILINELCNRFESVLPAGPGEEDGLWAEGFAERCGEAQTVQRNCLQEADKIINGERQDMYGSPEDSFEIIAGYWNVLLRQKIKDACRRMGIDTVDIPDLLTPLDTTNMQVLFKQARKLGQKPCRDNYVDSCGYEAIGADRLMKEE